jgi:hypothetical protein
MVRHAERTLESVAAFGEWRRIIELQATIDAIDPSRTTSLLRVSALLLPACSPRAIRSAMRSRNMIFGIPERSGDTGNKDTLGKHCPKIRKTSCQPHNWR